MTRYVPTIILSVMLAALAPGRAADSTKPEFLEVGSEYAIALRGTGVGSDPLQGPSFRVRIVAHGGGAWFKLAVVNQERQGPTQTVWLNFDHVVWVDDSPDARGARSNPDAQAARRRLNAPKLSAAEAVKKATAHLQEQGQGLSDHFVHMVDAMNPFGDAFWRVGWVLRSPGKGTGRIYADVRDDGTVTYVVREARPPARQLNIPQTSVGDALEKAKAYVTENNIDVSDSFVKRIRVSDLAGNPRWDVTWSLHALVKGGQTFVHVYDDGEIKCTYGK